MMVKGLFVQLVLLASSVAIIFLFIQPRLDEVGTIQDETQIYIDEREDISDVNERLSELSSRIESVSFDDRMRLNTFLPDEIDFIQIIRDLYIISVKSGSAYIGADYNADADTNERRGSRDDEVVLPDRHVFSLQVSGGYENIKDLVAALENNDYPLEVAELTITKQDETDLLDANLTLHTYSYNSDEQE